MKKDYLANHKYKPRKPWWDTGLTKELQSKIYQEINQNPGLVGNDFVALGLNQKELYKHTLLEETTFADGTKEYLLAYFPPAGTGSRIFSFSL